PAAFAYFCPRAKVGRRKGEKVSERRHGEWILRHFQCSRFLETVGFDVSAKSVCGGKASTRPPDVTFGDVWLSRITSKRKQNTLNEMTLSKDSPTRSSS
ncbi:hypothetical protein, partial [Pseudomonas guariconensis]|uniref:hypothetical protein n=1 Tax=Pseudomonas guariconensis TaxID=1288410 RepID=UPI001E42490A